jgi:serine/threonine protein kinase
MPNYFITSGGQRQSLRLDPQPIGRGGEANVYRVAGMPGCLAKIYHRPASAADGTRAKLEAMLQRPPQTMASIVNGKDLPLFAWPTHVVDDDAGLCAGFLMPEIPLDRAVTLGKYMGRSLMKRGLSQDDQSLPRRILVCRNLASVIAELHRQKHYFVDIKPQNIYMFRDTGTICLVDNDSFSIAGIDNGPRFPASAYSSEYLAPELLRNGMGASSVVSDAQDRFALAVLMFQILNNGLHPFQGSPRGPADEWNIDLCVKLGYYPHGLVPHAAIAPSRSSCHDCWDVQTRQLFDRAFTAAPSQRPSAVEWRSHLERLHQDRTAFQRCAMKPDDVLHLHFAALPCPECRLTGLDAPAVQGVGPKVSAQLAVARSKVSVPYLPPPSNSKRPMYWLVGLVLLLVIFVLTQESNRHSPPLERTAAVPAVQAAPGPAPYPAQEPAPLKTPAVSAAPPARPVATDELLADERAQARLVSHEDDVAGIQARIAVIASAVSTAVVQNRDDLSEILANGLRGDDAATLASAQEGMRRTEFTNEFAGWKLFHKTARRINEEVLQSYRMDLDDAVRRQSTAVAFNPYDKEIVGNLAFYFALQGNEKVAMNLAMFGMSLPRHSTQTSRSADWQLVGSIFARLGQVRESTEAYFVALAITPKLSGFCKSLLAQQAIFGSALKVPIEAVFDRIEQRGRSDEENCANPPAWQN